MKALTLMTAIAMMLLPSLSIVLRKRIFPDADVKKEAKETVTVG